MAHLVNVAQSDLFHALVLQDFPDDTSISTSDNEYVFGVGMGSHGKVRDHLLVAGAWVNIVRSSGKEQLTRTRLARWLG